MTEGIAIAFSQLADESRPVRSIDLHPLSDVPRDRAGEFSAVWGKLGPERRLELLGEMVEQAETHIDLNFHAVLRTLLEDADAQVRRLAIEGLWEDEKISLIAPLAALLKGDTAPAVRAAAATSLGRYIYLGAMDEIAMRHADAAEEALREAWFRPGEVNEVRRRTLESLSYTETQGLNEMIRNAYYDEDEQMRQSAVFAMGRTGDSRWSKLVMEETGSSDPAMRFEAAQAAGEMGLKPAVRFLIRLLDDPDSSVREAAIAALGKIGGTSARRTLEYLIRSEDEALAQAADDALGELKFISSVTEDAQPDVSGHGDLEDEDDLDLLDDDEYDDEYADADNEFGDEAEDQDWDDEEEEEDDGDDY